MSSYLAEPDGKRPEPVVFAGRVASIVGGVITLAAAAGLVSAAEADVLNVAGAALLTIAVAIPAAVAPVIAAYRARRKVTPTADPKDNLGRALVPDPSGTLR